MAVPYINFDYVNEQANNYSKGVNNDLNDDFNDILNNNFNRLPFKLKSLHHNQYFDIINKYLQNNLDNILTIVKFPREENGSYKYSWQGNEGEISYTDDSKPVIQYLKQHKEQITNDNIDVDWDQLIDKYVKSTDFLQFGKKIRQYIINQNNNIIKQRANYLEQLDDKVNDYISINYNPASDHEREKPIVVIRVELNKKIYDKVYIGKTGQSHGGLITTIIMPELISIHAKVPQPTVIHQAYLLGTIAFMDPNMPNTYDDLDQVKKILINDERITKIYTVPVNKVGNIVRVAKINGKKNLGVDIDNCLNNLNNRLLKLVKKYYNTTIDEKYYDIREELGLTNKEWLEFLNLHKKEIKTVVENQCQYYLKKLQKIYNIYIITARPYSFANETIQWLKLNKISYDDIFFRAGNKVDVCKFLDIDYMIEDSPWNILALQKNGINCLVYNRPYNQRIKNNDFVERIYNWQNIYQFLTRV